MIKKHWQLFSFFVLVIIAFIYYKTTYQKIVFKRFTLERNNEIDTLERYHHDSLLLVNILDYGFLGHFSMRLGYIRNFANKSAIFESEIKNFQIFSNYVWEYDANVNRETNHGWFNIDNNENRIPLSKVNGIVDSLRNHYPPLYYILSDDVGNFTVDFPNGKQCKEYNYGNIITGDSATNFYKMEFGLYKLENYRLIKVSDNSNDLYKKGKGLFFVPKPGLGFKKKFKKAEADSIFMSFHSADECPNRIIINPE